MQYIKGAEQTVVKMISIFCIWPCSQQEICCIKYL